jgi:hypothetical protein
MRLAQETINNIDNCRDIEVQELVNVLRKNRKVWSWGAHNWTNIRNRAIAFRVSGMLFKGNVALMVNGSDLFDVHLCSSHGNLKHTIKDVFIGDLIDAIDEKVELIHAYVR